jgi:AraC-like DNA-binding protein
MVFKYYPSTPPLQQFVIGYLESDSRDLAHSGEHTLFPNGYSGIFFNFGNMGRLDLAQEYITPAVSIFGQIDCHFKIHHVPGLYSLGVLLKPTVLSKFLREDMAAFTNKAVEGKLLRNDLKALHSDLEAVLSVKERITLLNQYFTKIFAALPTGSIIADSVVQLIHHQPNISIKKIAEQLKISDRHLETQFKISVGLSPKTYSLIVRFKNAEQQLLNNSSTRWSALDFNDEYYDQNHFIKDFKRFTGHTPSDYLLQNFEMGRSYLVR